MTHVNFAVTTLLNGIWEGTLLAVAMWLFLKLLPRLNPTTRFVVLWITLLAVLALLLEPFAPRGFKPGAPTDLAVVATNNSTVTTPTPLKAEEPKIKIQTPDASYESHPVSVPRSSPGPVFEQPTEPVRARSAPSPSRWAAITAVDHPLIRIHSAKILDAFEIAWVLLSFVMLVRLGRGYGKLLELKARATQVPADWQMRLRRLKGINGVRRKTQLLVSSDIAAPMSLGFFNPAILIPRMLLDRLSDSELEHVVLHELCHLWRRDDWTNLAQRLIEALLPIQPVVYWIGHRMSIEREMACDDWVIAVTGTAESYATSLARVAELSQWAHAGILAAGATGNRSQLFSRVRHMLDRTRNAAPKLTIAPLGAAIAALGILIYVGGHAPQMIAYAQTSGETSRQELVPLRPAQSIAPRALSATPASIASPASKASVEPPALVAVSASPSPRAPFAAAESPQSGETHTEITIRNGVTSLSVKVDGTIEFTDDDRDVKSLSPGGHFRMEEGNWLSGRRYDVKADSAGNLTKTYSVGSSVKPMDSEGQEWLGRLLPQIIRDSGIGAAARVARILRQGGPQAVINEIGLIHSDGSKRIYLEQLFSHATLNTDQLTESARLIRGISSDGDKAQVLIDVDGKYFTGEQRPHLFEAVESISSDGDKRRVLSDILKKDAGSGDTLFGVTRAAKHISSDGDKAEVLIEMAGSYRDNGGLGMAYFDAVKSISSDGDHARVLSTVLAAHGDDRDTVARVLGSAGKISSDGDKARVLKEAVARYSADVPVRKAFIDAANSISSDGDHQQVLVALVHRPGIDTPTIDEIAKSAQRISSDGDKARVLVELVGVNVEAARGDFIAAADTIQSDGDHSQVLMALLDKPSTSSAMAVAAIQSATRISSDGDKARVLVKAAQRYSRDPQVDAALRKAVESLHSDGEYRSVMSEISRRGSG